MTELAFIRHGRTQWNTERRLTGRADIALSAEGEATLRGLAVHASWHCARWHVSPLIRARRTAAILGAKAARTEERLIEMHFGQLEGRTLDELRADPALEMAEWERLGLDFLPPGGESPRMVQARLKPFMDDLAAAGGRHVAVAHKSVIRAVLSLAYDWPMQGRPPVRLDWDRAHIFALSPAGEVRPARMNVSLAEDWDNGG